MAGVMTGMLLNVTPGMAKVNAAATQAYVGIGANAILTAFQIKDLTAGGARLALLMNLDPAQLVAEYLVLNAMKNVKDNWKPEPAKEYEKAAENNGGGDGGGAAGGVQNYDSAIQKLAFQAASLENVGIEAIGVGPELSEIATAETRTQILSNLAGMQEKSSAAAGTSGTTAWAGSCGAAYSVCVRDLTTPEQTTVRTTQIMNKQNYGTAGVAHAELGLRSVQQAIVNDGDSEVGSSGTRTASDQANASLAMGQTTPVQDLSGLIGIGKNTVAAMKIVALMNLELAQRLNQGNMMQGSALTIEAARAFPEVTGLTE